MFYIQSCWIWFGGKCPQTIKIKSWYYFMFQPQMVIESSGFCGIPFKCGLSIQMLFGTVHCTVTFLCRLLIKSNKIMRVWQAYLLSSKLFMPHSINISAELDVSLVLSSLFQWQRALCYLWQCVICASVIEMNQTFVGLLCSISPVEYFSCMLYKDWRTYWFLIMRSTIVL